MDDLAQKLDAVVYDPRWLPRRGWHDDHREHDGTNAYLPAVMQVRSEFLAFAEQLPEKREACLQLGLGPCDASHELWRVLFNNVITIDLGSCRHNEERFIGRDSHDQVSQLYASMNKPYDLLFIDAGHTYEDVRSDFFDYENLVCLGGIIAFHDALLREAYPEVRVHQLLEELDGVTYIGAEVGIAWVVK